MQGKQSLASLALVVGLGLALAMVLTMSQPLSAAEVVSCFAEYTGDGITDFASADASAVQQAVDAASPGTTLKVAGDCTGVAARAGVTQTVYITKSLTLQGGYDPADWLGEPDLLNRRALLAAQWKGRVLYVKGVGVELSLSGLDIFSGAAEGLGGGPYGWSVGGGIYALTVTLNISNCVIYGNTASDEGGGIYVQGGRASISESTISANSAQDAGAIFAYGPVAISNSTLARNTVGGYGGAIFNAGQAVTITNSAIYSNTAGDGGGIYDSVGKLTVANSTISLNSASNSGGAIFTYQGTVDLNFCTGYANSAATCGGFGNDGGNATWANTIMANSVGADCCKNNGVITDSGFNLVRSGDCGFPEAGDPRLGPLQINAPGRTSTHALLDGSPARDAVTNPAKCTLPTDQRGVARPDGPYCDIGAFERELRLRCYAEHTGDNVTDFSSEDAYAVQQAVDAVASGGTVKVAGTCAGVREWDAMSQTVYVSKALSLVGGYTTTNWLAASDPKTHPTTLDARGQGRVINIVFPSTESRSQTAASTAADVLINGLTVRGGNGINQGVYPSEGCGGGIHVGRAQVSVANVDVVSNTAMVGGGIWNDWDSTIDISDSTISGNTATDAGGGMANAASARIVYSLVASNTIPQPDEWTGYGAGLYNLENLTVTHCTLSGNIGGNPIWEGGGSTGHLGTNSVVRTGATDDVAGGPGTDMDYLVFGGAIYNYGHAWVSFSTLSGNLAFDGGGIQNVKDLDIWLSTISGNVSNQGAGIFNGAEASSYVMHSTIAANSAAQAGGGIYNWGTLTLANSIIADSPGGLDCVSSGGKVSHAGYNLIEDDECSFHDTGDPKLGPLQLNAPGDTATHALLKGSPAIDGVADASMQLTSVDQRGVKRPQGGYSDIGAYEVELGKTYIPIVLRSSGP